MLSAVLSTMLSKYRTAPPVHCLICPPGLVLSSSSARRLASDEWPPIWHNVLKSSHSMPFKKSGILIIFFVLKSYRMQVLNSFAIWGRELMSKFSFLVAGPFQNLSQRRCKKQRTRPFKTCTSIHSDPFRRSGTFPANLSPAKVVVVLSVET
jgi:hypothetical protein